MSPLRAWWASSLVVLIFFVALAASGYERSLLLFGGQDRSVFLGCLSCSRSEAFSVWNPNSQYGSTTHPDSIWNRDGRYGAKTSLLSPWNPWAPTPPIVVDRAGNLYGQFTRNANLPGRIPRPETLGPERSSIERDNFKLLNWILDEYDGIVEHLDEARMDF
jgi:hypothetical protein